MNGQPQPIPFTRFLSWVSLFVSLMIGLFYLLAPFVDTESETWAWRLTERKTLQEMTVRGKVVSIDDQGATLRAEGSRPLSLISPPVLRQVAFPHTLRVEANLPDLPAGRTIEVPVRILWQNRAVPEFHFVDQTATLSREPADIYLNIPVGAWPIHRIGIQFPELRDSIKIRWMGHCTFSASERFRVAASRYATPEPIVNHSINFLRGPAILARSLNYFLGWGIVAALSAYAFIQVIRRRPISRRWIAVIILIAWLFVDLQATSSLARQTWREFETFSGKSPTEQIVTTLGEDLAWAYEQLIARTPSGATFAVCSDDPFTPSHRLAYYLAPARTRVEKPSAADYILVSHQSGASFDAAQSMLKLPENEDVCAEQIVSHSSEVYLLRRTRP